MRAEPRAFAGALRLKPDVPDGKLKSLAPQIRDGPVPSMAGAALRAGVDLSRFIETVDQRREPQRRASQMTQHTSRPKPRVCTTRPTNTTPAASASSRTSRARSRHSIVEQGLQILQEPDASRRGRRRSAGGRRRRHPDPDAGPVLPRRNGQAGRHAAAARANTASAWCSCRRSRHRGWPASTRSSARSRTKARCCSAGATCRATTPASASRSRRSSR